MCWTYPVFNDSVSEVLFRQPFITYCRILPKFEKESENPSSRSLLTFHVFAQLSHLLAVRQGFCCSYLTCSCKERKNSDWLKLTNKLRTESVTNWYSEPTSLTLRVPTCPLATFYVLDCIILKHDRSLQFSLASILDNRRYSSWVAH